MPLNWPPQNRYWTRLTRHSPNAVRSWLADTIEMLSFLTVLPKGRLPGTVADFTLALRAAPLAGLVIGAVAGLVLVVGSAAGLPPLLLAVLTVAASVAVTGALHEDGLSDVADGFGGGETRAHKLEIMRDSRTGSYGAVALILTLTTRIAAIAGLIAGPGGSGAALAAVIAAAVVSRGACVAVLHLLPPARGDGLGATAGAPTSQTFSAAMAATAVIALPCLWLGINLPAAVWAAGCAAAATWGVVALARAQIGGQTGDVAGAGQQAAECAVLVATAGAAGL